MCNTKVLITVNVKLIYRAELGSIGAMMAAFFGGVVWGVLVTIWFDEIYRLVKGQFLNDI